MIFVSRKENFNAAHKLYREDWSFEKNNAVFGRCANKHWHGHNFELIVTVKGIPNENTGFVMDLRKLSQVVQEEIIETVDHKNLNLDVPYLRGLMPSCENLLLQFWRILYPKIKEIEPQAQLHQLRLYETPRNYVDYFGSEVP